MKAVVAAFNQEKALVAAFSVIVKPRKIFDNLRFKLKLVEILYLVGKGAGQPRPETQQQPS